MIVCDNVVRDGRIADADSREPASSAPAQFFDMLAAEPRLSATAMQTVGAKGWDGFAIARRFRAMESGADGPAGLNVGPYDSNRCPPDST